MIDQRIVAEFDKRCPFPLTGGALAMLCVIGSESQGVKVPNTDPDSIDDMDLMGVVIPPPSYVLGVKQWEGANFWVGEYDCVFYSLQKFVRLLLKSNPNVLGTLWLRDQFYHCRSDAWDRLRAARMLFSSLDAYHSFTGYAYGQMKKMTAFDLATKERWDLCLRVVAAMGWEKDQVTAKLHREMPDSIGDRLRSAGVPWPTDTGPEEAARTANAYAEELQKLHARHFQGYMGEKRKALVVRHGYDTKNAAHLIRLMRMCTEFLRSGGLRVYREEDAGHLRAIKAGAFELEHIQIEAAKLFEDAKVARDESTLPEHPDVEAVDALLIEIQRAAYIV